MTADPRIGVTYLLTHPPAPPQTIKDIIERLRQRAIELGLRHVTDLVCLTTEQDILDSRYGTQLILPMAAIYFSGSLFDSDPAEFGLCSHPVKIEIGGATIPFGIEEWTRFANARTRDMKILSELFDFAAALGMWVSMTVAGMTISCQRDASGTVVYEQERAEDI